MRELTDIVGDLEPRGDGRQSTPERRVEPDGWMVDQGGIKGCVTRPGVQDGDDVYCRSTVLRALDEEIAKWMNVLVGGPRQGATAALRDLRTRFEPNTQGG